MKSKNVSFSKMEKENIKYWDEIDIIKKIVDNTKNYPKKIFIDGPPFPIGIMHYGHILISTIKDMMIRYLTMSGYKVERSLGYDTHGLPIEMIVKDKIGYNKKEELIKYGIEKHNKICKDLITEYKNKWDIDFKRIGRWINVEYKTMDKNFMESVMWAFKELYEKNMIYKGYKVMPYSTGCNTVLSHFEAKQNYKNVIDTSIICCFEVFSTEFSVFKHYCDYPTYILAWTTTPWTLFSNMAICTFKDGDILYLFDNLLKAYLLISANKYDKCYAKEKIKNINRFIIIDRIYSDDLIDVEYKPPFDFFWKNRELCSIKERSFRIITDHYVKYNGEASGTGFVHCAPAHGEEDFRVCQDNGIIKNNIINIIDDDGCFISQIKEYEGIYVKDAEKMIIQDLKNKNLLFDQKDYYHSYPFCYITQTPLLYRITEAWFLKASNEDFREKMLDNNKKINWIPQYIGTNNFDNWLQDSVDWCISRTRYWGTPIPIWTSDNEILCIGSIKELEKLSGKKINDLHIQELDKIKIPYKNGFLSRVDGVIDCWFESGSVPYAQYHYPFKNNDNNISDFIVESIDQTRGWFYTLTVLATALFNKPAFKNVIVTGIVNDSNNKKLSKNKNNYIDPNILIEKYGADTIRLYLLSTPIIKAESIKFNENVLLKFQQKTVVKIYNLALFLIDNINNYKIYGNIESIDNSPNILDKWIINKTNILSNIIIDNLDKYNINIASYIINYIHQLSNWYVKLSKLRLRGLLSIIEWKYSLQTLLFIINKFIIIVAPIIPFITETVYQMLNNKLSIHLLSYPKKIEVDILLENKFNIIQKIIVLIRKNREFNLKRPIDTIELYYQDWNIIEDVLDYIEYDTNTLCIKKLDITDLIIYKNIPNIPKIYSYDNDIDFIINKINNNEIDDDIKKFVLVKMISNDPNVIIYDDIIIKINKEYTNDVKTAHLIRLINVSINIFKKKIKTWNNIYYYSENCEILDLIKKYDLIYKHKDDLDNGQIYPILNDWLILSNN